MFRVPAALYCSCSCLVFSKNNRNILICKQNLGIKYLKTINDLKKKLPESITDTETKVAGNWFP